MSQLQRNSSLPEPPFHPSKSSFFDHWTVHLPTATESRSLDAWKHFWNDVMSHWTVCAESHYPMPLKFLTDCLVQSIPLLTPQDLYPDVVLHALSCDFFWHSFQLISTLLKLNFQMRQIPSIIGEDIFVNIFFVHTAFSQAREDYVTQLATADSHLLHLAEAFIVERCQAYNSDLSCACLALLICVMQQTGCQHIANKSHVKLAVSTLLRSSRPQNGIVALLSMSYLLEVGETNALQECETVLENVFLPKINQWHLSKKKQTPLFGLGYASILRALQNLIEQPRMGLLVLQHSQAVEAIYKNCVHRKNPQEVRISVKLLQSLLLLLQQLGPDNKVKDKREEILAYLQFLQK